MLSDSVLPLLGGAKTEYAHVAVGTSAATIIVASLRSVAAHAKRGAVDFEILKTWAPWLIIGDAFGVVLAGHVDGHGLLLIFAIGVLLMSVNFLVPKLSELVISDQMPWLGLTARKSGWDLPLNDQDGFARIVEETAGWDQDKFDEWARSAWEFARHFIENPELQHQYLQLFA